MTRTGRTFGLRLGWAAAALALLCLAWTLAQGQDEGASIADVRVAGARRIPEQRVLNEVKVRKGQTYRPEVIREDVRKLDATQWYHSVAAEEQQTPDGVVVIFRVIERATIQEVVFDGAKHFDAEDLETATGLRKGMPMSPALNRKAVVAIEQKYLEKGRILANVDLLEGGKEEDTRVVFRITEGPIVRVNDIRFEGNQFVSAGRLKTQINSGESFLGYLGGKYNPAMLEQDVNKLLEYYRSFGFFDVKIRRKLEWNPDYQSVDVVFVVDEGVRYLTQSVTIAGNNELPTEILQAANRVEEGRPYDGRLVQASSLLIQSEYGRRGRVNSRVVPEMRFSEEPGQVHVVYQVVETPPAKVGEIIIFGNTVTRQNVILRQIPVYPGQVLDVNALKVGERNLARLNIFEVNPELGIQPTITILDQEDNNEYKNLGVQIQEARTGSLLFGVGINSDAGATANIVLNERNFDITRFPTSIEDILENRAFRGAGQEFRVELVPGTELNRATVSWREPFLFDSSYSLGTSGYLYRRAFSEYNDRRTGGRVTVGHRFTSAWSGNVAFRGEDVFIDNVAFFAPQPLQEIEGSNTVLAPRVSLVRDTRDSYLRPTEGNLFEVGLEYGFGSFTYPIFTAEFSQFWTVYQRPDGSGRHVIQARVEGGIAGDDTPAFDKFYAGGFRSLRGFEFRGVGPDEFGFKVGGDFMLLGSVEYQFPIMANDHFYGVIFSDFGTVEEDIEITTFRVSAGAGLRLIVPMFGPVPIALDWGYPIVKADTDNRQVFSFWVGFFR